MNRLRSALAWSFLFAAAQLTTTWAQTPLADSRSFAVLGGLRYTDNVGLAGNSRGSGSIYVGADLDLERSEGRLRYDAKGQLLRYQYFDSIYGSDYTGGLFGRAEYDIAPGRFKWNADASIGQTRTNVFLADVPGNRGYLINGSTGPTWLWQFGSAFEMSTSAHVGINEFEERNGDSTYYGGKWLLGRKASQRNYFGIGAGYDEVDFRAGATGTEDFTREEAMGRFDGTLIRTQLSFEAGVARAKGRTFTKDEPFYRARLTRKLRPSLDAFVAATREFPVNAGVFSPYSLATSIGSNGLVDTTLFNLGPRLIDSWTVGVGYDKSRTRLTVAGAYSKEQGLLATAGERKVRRIDADLQRRFTPRSQGRVYASVGNEKLSGFAYDVDESQYGAGYVLQFGGNFAVDAEVGYRHRSRALLFPAASEYTVGVGVRYGRLSRKGESPFERLHGR